MNVVLKFKKVILLTMVLVFGLILVACKTDSQTPYGDLKSDPYVNLGKISVSEKDLYDQLRFQGTTILSNMIDKVIFKNEIADAILLVKTKDPDTLKQFNEKLNSAIFSITDLDNLKKYYEKSPELFYRSIETFVNNIYLTNNLIGVDRIDFVNALYECGVDGFENVDDHITSNVSLLDVLLNTYASTLAQKLYAKSKLVTGEKEGDIYDEKSTVYINQKNDVDLVNYYNANKVGKYSVSTFVVQFLNLNEANAALELFGLKSDSKGSWYKIPDIRLLTRTEIEDESSIESSLSHVKSILEDLKLLTKIDNDGTNERITLTDYENYYNKYTISTSRNNGKPDEALTTYQVLEYFVEIQNVLDVTETLKVEGTDEAPVIKYSDGSDYEVVYTYDELNKLNSSIRTHVYTTLVSNAKIVENDKLEDGDENKEEISGKPYSARLQTASNIRYLAFKLDDESVVDEDILVDSTDDDGNEIKIFGDSQKAIDLKNELLKELIDSKLTDSYITSKITEVYQDVKIDIYDRIVREVYSNSYEYNGKTKAKDKNTVATINGTDITVRQYFDEMEVAYGINLSLDLLTNKYLESTELSYISQITAEDQKKFKTQFSELIGSFSNDTYAQNGFPASMGREKFLLLAFSSLTDEEAIKNLYVYPKLRELFYADYEAHYGDNSEGSTNTIYDKFAELAKLQHDLYKSITVSHLLVYFDENNDGTPDDPEEFLSKLDPAKKVKIEEDLIKLVELVLDSANTFTSFVSGFTQIATNFQSSGRINRGNKYFEPTVEMLWSNFRKSGFNLKYESISSAITNTSNFPTASSTLDKVFYNEAVRIYSTLTEKIEGTDKNVDIELPYSPFVGANSEFKYSYDFEFDPTGNSIKSVLDEEKFNDNKESNLELLNSVKSSFGYHIIVANSFSESTSAEYNEDADSDLLYTNEDGLNCYNKDSKTILASQIKYYLKEQASEEGASLPSAVQNAITNYFTPVFTRYQNDYMNREIVFKLLTSASLSFTDAANNARFAEIKAINRQQLAEYLLSTSDAGLYDVNYAALYGTWFEILES